MYPRPVGLILSAFCFCVIVICIIASVNSNPYTVMPAIVKNSNPPIIKYHVYRHRVDGPLIVLDNIHEANAWVNVARELEKSK